MKLEGLVFLVDHRQPDSAALRLFQQLAVFLPAVQGRKGIELPLDGPISANGHVIAAQ